MTSIGLSIWRVLLLAVLDLGTWNSSCHSLSPSQNQYNEYALPILWLTHWTISRYLKVQLAWVFKINYSCKRRNGRDGRIIIQKERRISLPTTKQVILTFPVASFLLLFHTKTTFPCFDHTRSRNFWLRAHSSLIPPSMVEALFTICFAQINLQSRLLNHILNVFGKCLTLPQN